MIKVGETTLISEQVPLMLCDGELCLNANNGKLSTTTLSTHIHSTTIDLETQLKTLLNLRKFNDAWETCKVLNATDNWLMLGNAAISDLDITFGMQNAPKKANYCCLLHFILFIIYYSRKQQ